MSEVNSYKDLNEEFVYRDFVTGRKGVNQLNKTKLSRREMDALFNDWLYEEQ